MIQSPSPADKEKAVTRTFPKGSLFASFKDIKKSLKTGFS